MLNSYTIEISTNWWKW